MKTLFWMLMLTNCAAEQQADPASLQRSVSAWIQAVSEPMQPMNSDMTPEETWIWWTADDTMLGTTLQEALKAGVDEASLLREVRRIVECTRKSPEIAFKLYLQCFEYFDPISGLYPNTSKLPVHEMIAKAQVELWCRHPEELERMVWFVVWASGPDRERLGMFLGTYASDVDSDEKFPSTTVITKLGKVTVHQPSGPGEWNRRRLFMFLACITGCSDMYYGKKPSELLEGYAEWYAKVRAAAKSGELTASGFSPSWTIRRGLKRDVPQNQILSLHFMPQTPFPDWGELPEPVSAKDLQDRN